MKYSLVLSACVAVILIAGIAEEDRALIRLPGTQPGQVTVADSVQRCTPCHADIVQQWSGSVKAHAPRDPVFNALLSITNKTTLSFGLDVAEYCLRCHSPSGWLEGRSHELTVQNLFGTDLDGVHCDFCHRAVDPLAPDTGASVAGPVPGYGNGMYVVMRRNETRRGTRGSIPLGHPSVGDPFLKSGEFCGVCHEVSNPYLSPIPGTTSPHRQVPLERTYSEWKLSWYAQQGEAGSCQSCHMTPSSGYASNFPGSPLRLNVASHDFTGGNTWLSTILPYFWAGLDTNALRAGANRARSSLARAARVEVSAGVVGDSTVALVRVTNLTGHKLPTGYPEGRRVFVSVVGKDERNTVLFESGKYDQATGILTNDGQLKKYEAKPGPKASTAAWVGLPLAPSYHMSFSDSIYSDNRIPPRGYNEESFRAHRAEPVGYRYRDGQYWDEFQYRMPTGVRVVEVSLYYQQMTKEFAEFLRDENVGNPYDWNQWGQRVYDLWRTTFRPELMATATASVQGGTPSLPPPQPASVPLRFILAQNYPNPFNSTTTIEFWLSRSATVSLDIYDLSGRKVLTDIDGELPAGLHSRYINASGLASGVYFYRLHAGTFVQTKKLLLLR